MSRGFPSLPEMIPNLAMTKIRQMLDGSNGDIRIAVSLLFEIE